jgi:release factor glutamine methyltransferase
MNASPFLFHPPRHISPAMLFDPAQVYQPEADTFLLLKAAQAEVRAGDRVLEIGTGSGTVAAGLPPAHEIIATDINPHAVACARQKGVSVVRTDLFCGIQGTFDLILFNPPYLPTEPEERIDDWLEYALDGGTSGRVVIERFLAGAGPLLAPEGRILLLISSLTGLDPVMRLISRYGFAAGIMLDEVVEDEMLYILRITRAV